MGSHEIIYTFQEFGMKNAMKSQPHLQEVVRDSRSLLRRGESWVNLLEADEIQGHKLKTCFSKKHQGKINVEHMGASWDIYGYEYICKNNMSYIKGPLFGI